MKIKDTCNLFILYKFDIQVSFRELWITVICKNVASNVLVVCFAQVDFVLSMRQLLVLEKYSQVVRIYPILHNSNLHNTNTPKLWLKSKTEKNVVILQTWIAVREMNS